MKPLDPGSDRLPPFAPAQWTDAQREVAEAMIAGPRGAVLAPFVPLLRSPELANPVQRLGEHLRYSCAIGARLTELAIRVTSSEWQQPPACHGRSRRSAGARSHAPGCRIRRRCRTRL